MGVGGRQVVSVSKVLHEQREHDTDHHLAGELRTASQAEAALLIDLDEIVDETDEPEPAHQAEHQNPGHRYRRQRDHVPDKVTNERRDYDHRAAHGWRTPLARVSGWSLFPDQLAIAMQAEDPNGQRCADQREHERDRGRDEDGLHRATSSASSAFATRSSPARRDALIRTTSPGASRSAISSAAVSASGTCTGSPRQAASAFAPASIGRASSPTTIRPATPLRATAADRPVASAGSVMPSSRASAAAASALDTLCSPRRFSRTGVAPSGVTSVKAGRPSSPTRTSVARTSAGRCRPKVTTRAAVLADMAATLGSSAFSTATPSAGRAAGSSAFAFATASRLPNSPMWARPTLRTTPSCGGAMSHSFVM